MTDLQQVESFVTRAEKELAVAQKAETSAREEIEAKGVTAARVEVLSKAERERETLEGVLRTARETREQLQREDRSEKLDDMLAQVREGQEELNTLVRALVADAETLVAQQLCPKIREQFDAKHAELRTLANECRRLGKELGRTSPKDQPKLNIPPIREVLGRAVFAALKADADRQAREHRAAKEGSQ
jgi:hypothetical protein